MNTLGSTAVVVLIAIIVLSMLALTAVSLWRSRTLWLFAAWAAGFFVIINFIHFGFFWHWGMIPLFLLFTCWFAEADVALAQVGAQRLLYGLLAITFTASAAIGAFVAAYEVRYPYSGAPAVAMYLQSQAAAGAPIVALGCHQCSTSTTCEQGGRRCNCRRAAVSPYPSRRICPRGRCGWPASSVSPASIAGTINIEE